MSVIVFAGAGASKALPKTNFPTTVEFFQGLPERVTHNPWMRFCNKFLESQKEQIDIEDVLWALQELEQFFERLRKPADIISYSISNNILALLDPKHGFGHAVTDARSAGTQIRELIDQVNALVYRLYAAEPADAELTHNWVPLLDWLLNSERRVDIFTTNYDTVIENAILNLWDEKAFEHYAGWTGRRRKRLKLENWQVKGNRKEGLLTKLHGSLDWKSEDGEVYIGDAVFTGDHKRQAIIYPGFKGLSEIAFFRAFHEYFIRRVSEADFIIFIGFAFRDEYVNSILRDNLATSARLFSVNPAVCMPGSGIRSPMRHLQMGFDKAAVSELQSLIEM